MKKTKVTATIIAVVLAASIILMPPQAKAGDDMHMRWIDWGMDYAISVIAFADCGLVGVIGIPIIAITAGDFCFMSAEKILDTYWASTTWAERDIHYQIIADISLQLIQGGLEKSFGWAVAAYEWMLWEVIDLVDGQ